MFLHKVSISSSENCIIFGNGPGWCSVTYAAGCDDINSKEYSEYKKWIEKYNGWGDFIAAELLTPDTVTWLSLWHEGELVVAQTRIRKGWTHGNRTLSGVTGVTGFNTTAKIVSVQEARTIGYAQFGAELTIDHDSRVLNSDNAVVTDAAARRQLPVSAVPEHPTAGQLFAQQVQISGAQ